MPEDLVNVWTSLCLCGFDLIVHGIVIIATLIIHPRVKVNLNVTIF
jgi:hypothetical protein